MHICVLTSAITYKKLFSNTNAKISNTLTEWKCKYWLIIVNFCIYALTITTSTNHNSPK